MQTLTLCASHSSHMWSNIALGVKKTVVAAVSKSFSSAGAVELLSHISPDRKSQTIERLSDCIIVYTIL